MITSAAGSLTFCAPVMVTIASIPCPSGRNAQCAADRIQFGAMTVPVQPAAESIEPFPSESQPASRKAIDGQSAMPASVPPTICAVVGATVGTSFGDAAATGADSAATARAAAIIRLSRIPLPPSAPAV